MYNVTIITEDAKYECPTPNLDLALEHFFSAAMSGFLTRIIDSYTGELYVAVNENGMANYCTEEWKYILIGYVASHENGLDVFLFDDDEEDDF